MSATETKKHDPDGARLGEALVAYRRASAVRGGFRAHGHLPAVCRDLDGDAARLESWANSGFFALAPLAAGLLIRLFLIQHDCGHGSFFPNKLANDWVGRALGVLTMTPYDHWRRTHAIHHATSGNLDRRGIGDIKTLTVREYFARNWRGRLSYRLYRHPLVMFGIGPAYMFLIESRLPFGFMRKGAMPWVSTMTTNAGIVLAAGAPDPVRGLHDIRYRPFADCRAGRDDGRVAVLRAASIRGDHLGRGDGLEPPEAALHGSSHYDLPPPLRWFSANIGVHHVHHLSSGVPFYRLPEILRTDPELREVGRLTLWQSLVCVRLDIMGRGNAAAVVVSRGAGGACRSGSGDADRLTGSPRTLYEAAKSGPDYLSSTPRIRFGQRREEVVDYAAAVGPDFDGDGHARGQGDRRIVDFHRGFVERHGHREDEAFGLTGRAGGRRWRSWRSTSHWQGALGFLLVDRLRRRC